MFHTIDLAQATCTLRYNLGHMFVTFTKWAPSILPEFHEILSTMHARPLFIIILFVFQWTYFNSLSSLACANIRFSSLFAAGNVSRGGTSATQRQKFHTNDANQCLHNKSGSHGVPNINLSSFKCLLVGFGKVLCSSANELQQNSNTSSREDYIPQILTVLLEILRVYIWPLWPFVFCLSLVNNS